MRAVVFVSLILILSPTRAVATAPPATPLVYENCCVFEYGCGFIQAWAVLDTLPAYAERGDSIAAFYLLPGDSVAYLRGDLVVERLGKVLIHSGDTGYSPGDTIYVTRCDPEGSCTTWANGRVGTVEQFWCPSDDRGDLLEPRKEAWWVEFARQDGRSGWLRLENIEECGFVFLERLDMRSQVDWH